MPLTIFNTLTGKKEEFVPLKKDQALMYVCGITPYDETHLGHGRAYVTFDIVRRHLEDSGYKVTYVQNITDIDDKIIKKSNAERVTSNAIADKYTRSYLEVMDQLNVKRATKYPKATEAIPDMIKVIKGLIDKGYAYELQGDVYFEVSKFKGYGKLSKRERKDMQAGARVEIDQRKKDPLDFALWKKAKEGEPSWDSPWGKGRPGWHMECSTMSVKFLGDTFDIHGGGRDLIFPHHENEIAQAEAFSGKPFARYWMHNGFVNVNEQKMSKSLGNFFTLKDIFKKFDPMTVRFFLLLTHYRSPINFSDKELKGAGEGLTRIKKIIADIDFKLSKTNESTIELEIEDLNEELQPYRDKFSDSMDDDFNTAGAIAAIFEMIRYCRQSMDEGDIEKECLELMKKSIVELCGKLGLTIEEEKEQGGMGGSIDEWGEIKRLIKEREEARKNKDFKKSDQIRDYLKSLNVIIEDTSQGTRWIKSA